MPSIDDYTSTDAFPPQVDIKGIRLHLGLTRERMAKMLETDTQTVVRMEMPRSAKTRRDPAARMLRLLEAYLDGWRPSDWPGDTP